MLCLPGSVSLSFLILPPAKANKKTNWTKLGKFGFLGVVFFHLFFPFLSFKTLFYSCLRLRSPTLPATNFSIHHTFSTINIIMHPQASNSLLRN